MQLSNIQESTGGAKYSELYLELKKKQESHVLRFFFQGTELVLLLLYQIPHCNFSFH